jgi:hypothetical protein
VPNEFEIPFIVDGETEYTSKRSERSEIVSSQQDSSDDVEEEVIYHREEEIVEDKKTS